MRPILTLFLFLCFSLANLTAQQDSTVIPPPPPPLETIELSNYQVDYEEGKLLFSVNEQRGKATITVNGEDQELEFANGQAQLESAIDNGKLFLFKTGAGVDASYKMIHFKPLKDGSIRTKQIPFILSILPPLVAIVLALIFKEVIVSLFIGVLMGAFVVNGMQFSLVAIGVSIAKTVDTYILNALNDGGHLSIILFSLLIGGMVGVISRNGGMAGVVKRLSVYAKGPQSTQFVTWLLGVAIFFDDYANTLIVGNTMRSVTDSHRVSREKLAYIVDSTAAPIAALAFVTTWIGFELGQIETGVAELGLAEAPSTYSIFLNSLKYSFYPIFTLIFILLLIWTKRDFGLMFKAEHRARTTGRVAPKQGQITEEGDMEDLTPVDGAPLKARNAVLPVLTVILVTLYGLLATGMNACYDELQGIEGAEIGQFSWSEVWANLGLLGEQSKLGILIGNSDSYVALIWASFAGLFVAILLTAIGGIMKLTDTMNTMIAGFKAMMPAMIILVLAWSLASTTGELSTSSYLTHIFLGALQPIYLPVIIFILAALISFSTGSSWSTMAILYPVAIPLTWTICANAGYTPDEAWPLMYNVISVVLAASVLGDHCSPISDTTILSSLATDCNHIEHVRTQLPYALTVGAVSLLFGFLSTAIHLPFLLSLVLGVGILFTVVRYFGKQVD
ncbi:MAG: Na+/H+ antiporter NhaC family protein [Bacteroidota bacterium]